MTAANWNVPLSILFSEKLHFKINQIFSFLEMPRFESWKLTRSNSTGTVKDKVSPVCFHAAK